MSDANSISNDHGAGWFVIWTESRAEKRVATRLAALGIEQWLPTVTERRKWSDRWQEVVLPLFPGYLFARANPACVHQLLRTPGVLTLVKAGTKPAYLSDAFVRSLRQALECSGITATAVDASPQYAPDDEVVVQEGPLSGLRGVVEQLRSGRRLVIWVREIGRGVAFTIESSLVARRFTPSSFT